MTQSQSDLAQKALAMKQQGDDTSHIPEQEPHAHDGVQNEPRPDYPPSGAFDAEGHRPVLERSRKVR